MTAAIRPLRIPWPRCRHGLAADVVPGRLFLVVRHGAGRLTWESAEERDRTYTGAENQPRYNLSDA